jgi:hypothetical protein
MNNDNTNFPNSNFSNEGISPRNEAKGTESAHISGGEDKLKEYGKKSLAPFVDLLHRYKDGANPYMQAIGKGLQGAVDALNSSEVGGEQAEKVVAGWFREAHQWFDGAKEKFSMDDPKDFLNYLEEQSQKNPGIMFSASYIVGMVFGRVGRQLGKKTVNETTEKLNNIKSSFNDQSSEKGSLH